MTNPNNSNAAACLAVLIVLQVVMLGALYAQIPPHPPATIPFFGIAPFLGASLAAAAAALILGPLKSRAGRMVSLATALLGLITFGPQKYFDEQFFLIWPAFLTGQFAVIVLFVLVLRSFRSPKPVQV